jgi:dihydrofolate reductase
VGIAEDMGYQRIYGIGGAGIYTALLPLADRLLITEVDLEVEDADTFFPKVASQDWRETGRYALRGNGPLLLQKEYLRAHTAVRA